MRIRFTKQELTGGTLAALEARWRELEARADPSVFQSWTWVGCRAAERFGDPWLLEGEDDAGRTVVLGLFNRRGRQFWLHEAGEARLDAPFIERNGIVVASGWAPALPEVFRALPAGLVLSGVDEATVDAARSGRALVSTLERATPVLDLRQPVLDSVSANTRAQLRRALRRYGEIGALSVVRTDTPGQAREFLDELMALHAARWQARGSNAFSDRWTVDFHHALIERGVARDEVDLLRVLAGERTVGLLYNLRFRGRVFAYQGGFDYAGTQGAASAAQMKPGMVCHAVAAEWYRARGAVSYDFGAGDARYKRSLATGVDRMHWVTLASPWSGRAMLAALRRRVRQVHPAGPGA